MANRIVLSAALTLALTLTPGLAWSIPTKSYKKSKAQGRVTKKSKSHKSRSYSRHYYREQNDDVVESSMVPSYPSYPSYNRLGVSETRPLMKVVPQRDGKFLLEPMGPPKKSINTPLSRPTPREGGYDQMSTAAPKYNKFEPWNFSDLVLSQAKSYRYAPYARGASLENSHATDCSGFTQFIYHNFKIDLPRSSAEQAQVGQVVTRNMDFSKLLPGDMLFFNRGGHIGHVGIYLGEGKMIHASNPRSGVTVTELRQPYYEGTFVVAKRVFEVQYPE